MQTQDASSDSLLKLWEWYDANKRLLIGAVVAIGVVVLGTTWYSSQREAGEQQAGEDLTKLLFSQQPNATVPELAKQFAKLATEHPGTVAAQRAQLQAASALFNSGQYADAQLQFQKYLTDNSGDSSALAASAQLGVAVCLESLGKPDALAAYQKTASAYAGTVSAEIAKQAVDRLTPKTPAASAAPVAAPAAAPVKP